MNRFINLSSSFLLASSLMLLTACGGSDKLDLTWTDGVFKSESQFKNFCENPRSGTDFKGFSFPDKQGSTLHENHWLRSWSNNTYLWYDEIIDQNPSLFDDPIEYFDELKTNNLTASGGAKDNFHFTFNTADYLKQSQSGVSSGYGLTWALISSRPPRELLVAFSEPNGPGAAQNILRGAEVLEIDGIDLVNDNTQEGVDTINSSVFRPSSGESHTFVIRDLGASQSRTVTLVAAEVEQEAILAEAVIPTSSGNVAYVMYNTFQAFSEKPLLDTFNQLAQQNITDLVLDLRYNGGGLIDIASELSYMVAGANNTQGKIFERTVFNDKHPSINPVTGDKLVPTPFYNKTSGFGAVASGTPISTLNLNRVFILSTNGTCSASESVINGLRGADVEVILIGDTTCGKPYGFYPTDNCGTTYFTIQLTGENDVGFGEYADGFSPQDTSDSFGVLVPGCSVADDFNHVLGDTNEALLKQALDFRETGTCNSPAFNRQVMQKTRSSSGLAIKLPPILNAKVLSNSNQHK